MSEKLIVLVIDDDHNKIRQIIAYLTEEYPDIELTERHSYQSGLKAALTLRPTLLVLDMTMPTFDAKPREDSGRERRYAGEQILQYLNRKHLDQRAVVITQFERFGENEDQITLRELDLRLAKDYPQLYLGAVFYQAGGTAWKSELKRIVSPFLSR
jgi:CheY-like chemotaxis protein